MIQLVFGPEMLQMMRRLVGILYSSCLIIVIPIQWYRRVWFITVLLIKCMICNHYAHSMTSQCNNKLLIVFIFLQLGPSIINFQFFTWNVQWSPSNWGRSIINFPAKSCPILEVVEFCTFILLFEKSICNIVLLVYMPNVLQCVSINKTHIF